MGFYEPQQGRILIDGLQTDKTNVRAFRRAVGFVGQDPLLLHGTLRENIAFADTAMSDQEIQEAMRIACLSDVLRDLPNGLETVIGERGYTLSGGQKCRVAIARAIVFQPAILLLDEANAMLESELERHLWQSLAESRKDKTTLILTHHPANIPRVDKRLHLEGGTIRTMPDTLRSVNPDSIPTTAR
jgi:ATP-binding cassette subfamily B protein